MRQDWVEFVANGDRVVVRPEYIKMFETQSQGYTKLYIDASVIQEEVIVSESYEQVKQKIMDAEKVGLSDVVVKHFTKDEYKRLLDLAECEQKGCKNDNLQGQVQFMQHIIDKLNEILKEGK